MKYLSQDPVLVAGGGGFIGGHLTRALLDAGVSHVRVVDYRPQEEWWQRHEDAENRVLDLREPMACREAVSGMKRIFNLACDMGGMGFIEHNKALCMLSVLINTHLLQAARESEEVERLFFASSACIYPIERQSSPNVTALKEADAYPANAEDGYGWEKLFSERMCRHFCEDFGIQTRVARYHNVYGPHGCWRGGREKAPAALSRKVAQAKLSGEHRIEIWGDGSQTRSFTYITDAVEGTLRLMESEISEPLNIGSEELVTINQVVDILEDVAGVSLERSYLTDAPQGVRGRNSDNTLVSQLLGWKPSVSLATGLQDTYHWIFGQIGSKCV